MSFWKRLKTGVVIAFKGLEAVNGLTIGKHKIHIKELPQIRDAVERIDGAIRKPPVN